MHPILRARSLAPFLFVAACHHGSGGAAGTGPMAASANAMPAGVTPALIARGDSIFNRTAPAPSPCARCHGPAGAGGQNGPSLKSGPWLHSDGSFDAIVATITTGIPQESIKDPSRRFRMNARGGPLNLTDAQIQAVAAYVWSISREKARTGE